MGLACGIASCAILQPPAPKQPVPAATAAAAVHVPQPRKPLQREVQAEAAASAAASVAPDQMVVHFIDVGQGDAELIEFSCAAVLIDTGGEKTAEVDGQQNLVDYLDRFFARRTDLHRTLKLIILSHPHIDHTNGVGSEDPPLGLLGIKPSITIESVVDDGPAPDDASGAAGQDALKAHVSANQYFGVTQDQITTTAGLTNATIDPVDCRGSGGRDPKITALWGRVDPSVGSWTKNENNNSVVVKVEFGAAAFLFMGDLEQEAIRAMLDSYSADTSIFHADVLKVGHHGSKNGTTAELLQAITPKIAVIGCGDASLSHATFSAYSFAHPNKVAIDLLRDTTNGVSMSRPSKTVSIGVKGADHQNHRPPQFTTISLDRAIYATGWDGNVDVTAGVDGTLSVKTGT
jgi:competence protein ComEC